MLRIYERINSRTINISNQLFIYLKNIQIHNLTLFNIWKDKIAINFQIKNVKNNINLINIYIDFDKELKEWIITWWIFNDMYYEPKNSFSYHYIYFKNVKNIKRYIDQINFEINQLNQYLENKKESVY